MAKLRQTMVRPGDAQVGTVDEAVAQVVRDTKGATAIEFGPIVALIAVAAIGALSSVGTKLSPTYNNASNTL